MTTSRQAVREALGAVGDLVLPVRCGGCAGPGGPLCRRCRGEVRASGGLGGPRRLAGPAGGGLLVWSGARFEGALREAVTAWKDADRGDLSVPLTALLSGALVGVLLADPALRSTTASGQRVLVVPVPPSPAARRRRGQDPVGALAAAAAAAVRGPPAPGRTHLLQVLDALRHRRRVADQSRLTREQRARNLAGALEVRPRAGPLVAGCAVVLVDDVVTTGATLVEGARALRSAGVTHVAAATVAATPGPSHDVAGATDRPSGQVAPGVGSS
ncbi:phosphoribosyltransferase family protein [Oryzobacter sp. R7]|uniref:phosphoribosyltransferase family protein n=1 Tax=Oryzobacter faecalis TaxID=3388656 RepID=UPI00398D2BE6